MGPLPHPPDRAEFAQRVCLAEYRMLLSMMNGIARDAIGGVSRSICALLLAGTALAAAASVLAPAASAQSLHEKIDAAIAAKAGGPVAPAASDAEFLRRAHLD